METLFQDIRYAFRTLLKAPGFTLIAVLSLALGIGANTAIFSIIDALMLKQLPVKDPQSLVLFGTGQGAGVWGGVQGDVGLLSELELQEVRKDKRLLQDAAGVFSFPFSYHAFIGDAAASEPLRARMVTGNYFTMLGVPAAAGRLFTEAVDQPMDAHADVVISYGWWRRRFGANPSVIGQGLRIGARLFTIRGVAAPEFFGTTVGESTDAWFPMSMSKQLPPFFDFHTAKMVATMHVIARLQPGVSAKQATAGATVLHRRFTREALGASPDPTDIRTLEKSTLQLTPAGSGLSQLRDEFSLSLKVLMVVVGLVLLIACANVANLLLARATAREKEIAIRSAIGSGRARVVRQLLTESLLLSCTGGFFGILLAMWGSQVLLKLVAPGPRPVALDVDPNLRVLGFTLAVSLLTGIIFGIAPAFRATSVNLVSGLREGGRGGTAGRSRMFAGRALVVVQVALSLLLLVGAGLFIRSFSNLQNIDTGFSRQNVLQFGLDTDAAGLKEDATLANLYERVETRVAAIPGVESASFAMFTFNQGNMAFNPDFEGHPDIKPQQKTIVVDVTGPDFREAAGIALVAGRYFTRQDTATSAKVAVINEKTAHDVFGNHSPLGLRVGFDPDSKKPDLEIIGIVKNVKTQNVNEDDHWALYVPYTQYPRYLRDLVVKIHGDPTPLIAAIRRAITETDRNLPVVDVSSMAAVVDRSLTQQHLIAQLTTFFGALALLLAAIGLYGILSYSVARRTSEIGVRMALGAQSAAVLWMILRETLLLIGLGVVIGVPVAMICSRYIESLLFGLKGTDVFTTVSAVCVLAAIGAFAGFLPARRASKVDPMVALRYE